MRVVVWVTFGHRVEPQVQPSQSWQLIQLRQNFKGRDTVAAEDQWPQHFQILNPLRTKYQFIKSSGDTECFKGTFFFNDTSVWMLIACKLMHGTLEFELLSYGNSGLIATFKWKERTHYSCTTNSAPRINFKIILLIFKVTLQPTAVCSYRLWLLAAVSCC